MNETLVDFRKAVSDSTDLQEKVKAGADLVALGKENGYDKSELREWFQAIYEVLLGQSQGPRFGSFIELYGITKKMHHD